MNARIHTIGVMRDAMRRISHAEGKRLRASSMKALFPNDLSNEGWLKAQLHPRKQRHLMRHQRGRAESPIAPHSPGQSAATPWVFDCVPTNRHSRPVRAGLIGWSTITGGADMRMALHEHKMMCNKQFKPANFS